MLKQILVFLLLIAIMIGYLSLAVININLFLAISFLFGAGCLLSGLWCIAEGLVHGW